MLIITAMVMLMIGVMGCGASGTADSQKQATAGSGAENGSAAKPDDEVRLIKHEMGTTEMKGTPKRVVTLYQGGTDVVVALGVKPVGVVQAHGDKPVYDYLKNELEGVQLLGLETQPNLEEIYKLKPDLIITSKFRHEAINDQLSKIAPTVMVKELYEWKEGLQLAGEALNRQDEAKRLLADWDKRVVDFKAKMGARLPIEIAIMNFRSDHARVYYMGYAGKILQELGFTRPPGHDKDVWGTKLSSKESIPDLNAEMIVNFYTGTDTKAMEKTYEEWTSHPLWKNLEAYKRNQIYMVDEVNWNLAGGYLTAHKLLDELYDIFKLQK
ncbi:ABC transporter substrate-binding protein [Paenibacillus sp. y28]|uniref:ABC transporter substrate-binding protein n=1 Tax=Paenibacillus sp. y28 TaxID=3129110 RepID=UPI003017953C